MTFGLLAILTPTAALVGCRQPYDDSRDLPAESPKFDTPVAAARSLVESLRREMQAKSQHRFSPKGKLREATLNAIDMQRIQETSRVKQSGRTNVQQIAAVVIDGWQILLARHIDELRWDEAAVVHVIQSPKSLSQVVRVPARGSHGDAEFRIECAATDGGEWRVFRVQFGAAQPATAQSPTSAPATQTTRPAATQSQESIQP